ncbi:hypothetical protein GW17_00046029 [Ensete ventricosum]|nr:hypothetical protein GW17_00046029 [Ensete ventricosum]
MAVPLAAHRHRLIRRLTGDITVFHGLLTVFRGGGATFPVAGKGGERPTLPSPGRLYDSWRSSYNRSISHVELATSAAQVLEGVMT